MTAEPPAHAKGAVVADVHVQRVAVAVECAVERTRTRTYCRRDRTHVGRHLEVLSAVGLAAVDSRREVVPVRCAGDEVGRCLGAFAREHLHGADGETVGTAEVIGAFITATQAEGISFVVDRPVDGGRPIVAAMLSGKRAVSHVARLGQEDAVAIRLAGDEVAADTSVVIVIVPRPCGVRFVEQFVILSLCRHAPVAAPVGVGRVVAQGERRGIVAAVGVVVVVGCGLAPLEVGTDARLAACADVHVSPLLAAGQSEVDGVGGGVGKRGLGEE